MSALDRALAHLEEGSTCPRPGCGGELMNVPTEDCTCWQGIGSCRACNGPPNLVCVACGEIAATRRFWR